MSRKLVPIQRNGEIKSYLFYCPGCKGFHSFSVEPGRWTFDGNLENPTFSPSLAVKSHDLKGNDCHLFLRKGKLQFLNDCKHELAGQTVDLPMFPE